MTPATGRFSKNQKNLTVAPSKMAAEFDFDTDGMDVSISASSTTPFATVQLSVPAVPMIATGTCVYPSTMRAAEPGHALSPNGEAFLSFVEYATASKVHDYNTVARKALSLFQKFVWKGGLPEIIRIVNMFSLEVAPLMLVLCFIFAGSSAPHIMTKIGCYVVALVFLACYTLLVWGLITVMCSAVVSLELAILRTLTGNFLAFTGY